MMIILQKQLFSFIIIMLNVCIVFLSNINDESGNKATSNVTILERYINTAKQSVNPRYRQKYHISAPVGWINDPNGFSYFKGEYHLFYQFYPYRVEWGPVHWGHVKSKNLVDWEYLPTALIPEDKYDTNGCFSGGAIEKNGELVLVYTSAIDTPKDGSIQVQNIASSTDGVIFEKYRKNPVLRDGPDGPMKDLRDPNVWRHNDFFYMVLGTATPTGYGRTVLYRSSDLIDWKYLGVLAESNGTVGMVWECPNFFELNGKYVLLISPPFRNQLGELFMVGYYVGSFDYDTNIFKIERDYKKLDFGHDFYATQTIKTVDGRRVTVGWMDVWGADFKEKTDKWSGTISLPRELSLDNHGNILMKPVMELALLREKVIFSGNLDPGKFIDPNTNIIEVIASINIANVGYAMKVGVIFSISDTEVVDLIYNLETQELTLDRGGIDGIRRVRWKPNDNLQWKIYFDSSSMEVFCGNGEVVLSSRIYPTQPIKIQTVGHAFSLEVYSLRKSVEN